MNESYLNSTISLNDSVYLGGYGNVTLSGSLRDTNNITITLNDPSNITIADNNIFFKSHLEERIDILEKQLNKIVDFINHFFDTNIKL